MQEEKKERQILLEDPESPIWSERIGTSTLEEMFQGIRTQLAAQGVLLSRSGFLETAGLPMTTPLGLLKLRDLGVPIKGFHVAMMVQGNGRLKG